MEESAKANGIPSTTSQTLSLTSFLFGNIDASGQLEGDFFDSECKQQLASLSRLGLGSLLRQVTENDDEDEDDDTDDETEEEEVFVKSPSAVDYSDINELLEEDGLSKLRDDDEDYDDPIIQNTPDEGSKSDSELMPPPPTPTEASTEVSSVSQKPCTPLAAMLPPKYANVDVRLLFPDFRQGSVLRFSRLFGPGKQSHLPKIWKQVRRKKRRRTSQSKNTNLKDAHSSLNPNGNCTTFTNGENQYFLGSRDMSDKFELKFGPLPSPEHCFPDEEALFSQPPVLKGGAALNTLEDGEMDKKKAPKESNWRFGPAQLWYDMLHVSYMGEDFDYGFKVKEKDEEYADVKEDEKSFKFNEDCNGFSREKIDPSSEFPDDAFHMVTQYNWEEDIIWNGDDIKHKLNQKRKNMSAGWVPSSYSRTAQAFSQPGKTPAVATTQKMSKKKARELAYANQNRDTLNSRTPMGEVDDTWYSIFPVENEELVYEKWEDDIIWDPDAVDKIPDPKVLTLDPNDENIILGIPEDIDPSTLQQGNEAPVKIKIPHPHVKKSKILLGKAGVITTIEEESPPPPPKSPDKDPYNLSNDEFYLAKATEGGGLIQHSTPVVQLLPPFVPTFLGEKKLRQFHRTPLKHFSHGLLARPGPHPVHSLTKEIKRKAKMREQERLASGGGDVFFMRNPEDLSGKDGALILLEMCEEHPPVICQIGMCTRIKNYYKRKIMGDKGPPEYRFGEVAYASTSPFLGSMHPGQSIQTLENNMYRTPMYEHKIPRTDFIIIRTRNGYSIREADALFCCGQQCPLYEIPGPNSKRANNFIRDFLQVFIYRLFWKSVDTPKRIKMDEIKRAFPAHSESSIRKRLKPCADFNRTGVDSNWWVIKTEFRLPTEDEIRAMVSPEQCSAFFSMLAAEQRLKDGGYGDKFLSVLEEDIEDDTQKLDDEIKAAPWHTTRAYIQAVKGKCLLQLSGPADPTGCGEGFSYIRIPNKPTQNKEEQDQQPKRIVTGTDADLRKLSLNDAKNLLRNYGVPEEEIKKLTRWEVIDVVRTLSTEKAKAGEESMTKFSRGNRFSIAEHQERYKEECQRIFDLQNRVLASEEVLSTDEGSSEEENDDSDVEEKGKYIENILSNKKTSSQMTMEKEEQERKELQKLIMGEDDREERKKPAPSAPKKEDEDQQNLYGFGTSGRVLRITRTFQSPDGQEYTRVETVRKTAIIDTYVKMRTGKDEAFIRNFAGQLDDSQKEEIKRERRRLQEQLRRIKRNQERLEKGIITPPKAKKPRLKPDLKLKCGACGQVGHMRTNKACPMYAQSQMQLYEAASTTPTATIKEEIDPPKPIPTLTEPDELVNVDGTKIKLSTKVFKHAEEFQRKSKSSRDFTGKGSANGRRRRAGTVVHCDYLKGKNKSVNRRRIDPVITMATIFEEMLNEMKQMSDVQPFLFPVNAKQVPDYYNVIHHPMDLATIRDNLREKKYQSREEFLCDVNQIVENSKLYNGVNSTLTAASERMLSLCIDRFAEKEDKLMRLEKAINPLLDDDDQVAFDYILDNIVNTKLFTMQESWPFMKPVNKKNVKDYYEIIQEPMDLQNIAKKVKTHKYHSRREFMHDMELILTNSEKYNGTDSGFTQKARTLVQFCHDSLEEYGDHLETLEKKIAIAQERALAEADADSLGDIGILDEDSNFGFPEADLAGSADGDNNVDVETPAEPLPILPRRKSPGRPRTKDLNRQVYQDAPVQPMQSQQPKVYKKRGRKRKTPLPEHLRSPSEQSGSSSKHTNKGEDEKVSRKVTFDLPELPKPQVTSVEVEGVVESSSSGSKEEMGNLQQIGGYSQTFQSFEMDSDANPPLTNIKVEPPCLDESFDNRDSSFGSYDPSAEFAQMGRFSEDATSSSISRENLAQSASFETYDLPNQQEQSFDDQPIGSLELDSVPVSDTGISANPVDTTALGFGLGLPSGVVQPPDEQKSSTINRDLEVSDSDDDEESGHRPSKVVGQEEEEEYDNDPSNLWF